MAGSLRLRRLWLLVAVAALFLGAIAPAGAAGPDPDPDDGYYDTLELPDRSDALAEHDKVTAALAEVMSSGPTAKNVKNVDLRGRGDRPGLDETTDVWVLGNYAYTGTFNSPCGGTADAGVWVWDVRNANKVSQVGVILSEAGDRTNDVKAASMNSGDILVMSNESCGGGDGGFEIYDVDDPRDPAKLASVTIDELNPISDALFGGITNVGVHNLFLFTQGSNDYVAAVAETAFDNFMIFDITDPTNPTLASAWGAEELFDPGVGDETVDVVRVLNAALWLLDGFGDSTNRFLHDITITADGHHAYLANWDAGLVLLDISDPANPSVVSVALDPTNGSRDGEVNSHSVWPSEDGSIVVEGEEDFDAWQASAPPSNLTLQNLNTIPGVAVSTTVGDIFEDPANQTSNAGTVEANAVTVTSGPLTGQIFDAIEFTGNNVPLGSGSVSGNLVWLGRACNGDPFVNTLGPGDIGVVRRGACFFSDKAANVAAAGGSAMVLANNIAVETPWSGLRIWDYSDPANPVLASLFDTSCSASPTLIEGCSGLGTYSAHNVIVETTGNEVKAYVSWYWDGMVVIDVTDPYNPVEVGRYLDTEEAGGFNDFWGVYKVPNDPFIYGSDRSGGLYIFKEQGSGSGN